MISFGLSKFTHRNGFVSFYRFWMMPALFLKKMVMGNFDRTLTDPEIADSIDFLVETVCQGF